MSLNDSGLIDRWEYHVEYLKHEHDGSHSPSLSSQLNALGNEGWELVTTTLLERTEFSGTMMCVLKRPRLQSADEEVPAPEQRPHRFSKF
jgi:hypothetical protein